MAFVKTPDFAVIDSERGIKLQGKDGLGRGEAWPFDFEWLGEKCGVVTTRDVSSGTTPDVPGLVVRTVTDILWTPQISAHSEEAIELLREALEIFGLTGSIKHQTSTKVVFSELALDTSVRTVVSAQGRV